MHLVGNVQTLEQNGGIALGGVAVFLADDAFKLSQFHAIGVSHIVLGIDGIALLHRRPQTLVTHDDGVDDGVGIERELVLTQDTELPGADNIALLRVQFTAEQLHKGRLARSVGSGQAIALARGERRRDFFKQYFGAVAHGHIAD